MDYINDGEKKMETPANCVIRVFGGVRPLARLLNLSPGTIVKWRKSGRIPSRHQAPLLAIARTKRIKLNDKMLVRGC